MIICLKNGRLLRNRQVQPGEIWVADGKIVEPQSNPHKVIDVKNHLIAPGYIDIQINGAFGSDFSSKNCQFDQIAQKLPSFGITSFLATIVSSYAGEYSNLIKKHEGAGACCLGFHLEGPFLSPVRKGAHRLECLRGFEEIESLEDFYGTLDGVKLITLAIELPNAEKHILALKQLGILVAAGHTEASFEQIEKSQANLITHLFNAMPPFYGRQPGPIGAALTLPIFYTIIADGIHCHPTSIRLAMKANPEGIILVSDAMSALGLNGGSYKLGDMDVTVVDGKATLKGTETLAGSIIGLDSAVRYLHQVVGCSVIEAIEAATLHPAQLLGITHQKGTLDVGSDADIILLDDALRVQGAFVGGIEQGQTKVYL